MDLSDILKKAGVPAMLLVGITFFGSWGFFDRAPLPLFDERAVTISIEEVAPNTFVIENEGATLKEFRVTLSASAARDASIALSCCEPLPARPRGKTPADAHQADFSFGDLSSKLATGERATITVVPLGADPVQEWSIRVRADGVDVTDLATWAAHWLKRIAQLLCVALVLYAGRVVWTARNERQRVKELCDAAATNARVKARVLAAFEGKCREWARANLHGATPAQVQCVLALAPERMLRLGATGDYRYAELVHEAATWALRSWDERKRPSP